jgi:acyl-CoA dehydrogenase
VAARELAPLDDGRRAVVNRLKQQVRDRGLWACHLGPELGGQGYGQLKLALLNEILGTSTWAPRIFGTQAPDTGNAEILAHCGTPEQQAAYLEPLIEGDIVSCFSMTEPQGGADPGVFVTRAVQDGDTWVIDGRKFFSSNARWASFFIVMAVTDPDAPLRERMSMFLVPAGTEGIVIERNLSHLTEPADDGSEDCSPTTTCGCPRVRCSAPAATRSAWRRPGSAAAGCTTPCGRSGPPSAAST